MAEVVEILTNIMQVDLNNLRAISNNLANINTTAYKSEVTTNTAFYPMLDAKGMQTFQDGSQSPTIFSDVSRQYSQGAVKATGNNLHVAIDGDGFFVVENQDSGYYTRRGELMVSSAGLLTLISGERIQGLAGDIFVGSKGFDISKTGEIIQDGKVVDKLSVMVPLFPDQLQYQGSGLARPESVTNNAKPAENYSVLQGYLETSNVDTTREVTSMIEMLRHFEASSKVLQTYDSAIGHTITELGRF